MESPFTRRDGPLDQGWLQGLLIGRRRVQSISLTLWLERDCWKWEVDRFKGSLHLFAGPISLQIEA